MLEDVLKSCESSPECTIIFCDEMSPVVQSLDHSFLEDLSEKITTLFQVHNMYMYIVCILACYSK